jgi:hypothetical protein
MSTDKITEGKHTPGPWKVWDYAIYPGIGSDDACILLSGDREEDCGVRGRTSEEAIANAKLIAAAPCLLKELQRLVSLIEPQEREGGLNIPGLATLNGARAAIAKATL